MSSTTITRLTWLGGRLNGLIGTWEDPSGLTEVAERLGFCPAVPLSTTWLGLIRVFVRRASFLLGCALAFGLLLALVSSVAVWWRELWMDAIIMVIVALQAHLLTKAMYDYRRSLEWYVEEGLMWPKGASLDLLKDKSAWVREETLRVFARMDPRALSPYVEDIVDSLKDRNAWVREGAVRVLAGMDPRVVLPYERDVAALLDDRKMRVRREAAQTLERIRPAIQRNSAITSAVVLGHRFISYREAKVLSSALRKTALSPSLGQRSTPSASEKIQQSSQSQPDPEHLSVFWGMVPLPICEADSHFLVTGSVGSGKTITLRLLMQSALKSIGYGLDHRALVYDGKSELYPYLCGMGLDCPVSILNPFDKRGLAWDIAADVTSPAAAKQVAAILIPPNGSAQPFFTDAARQILFGVFLSLMRVAPAKWTLRDVLLSVRSREILLTVLSHSREAQDTAQLYIADEAVFAGVLATIATKVQRFEVVAACWHRTRDKISLQKWLSGEEGVILLGNAPTFRASIEPIYQAIFWLLSDMVLAQSNSSTRRTWIILDEAREAGHLRGLTSLLSQGRSKGACMVLGFESIEGMREVYGVGGAREIVDLCNHKAFLRTDSVVTAKWAYRHLGEAVGHEEETIHPAGSPDYRARHALLDTELQPMPPTGPEHGLCGYYQTPSIGTYFAREPWSRVIDQLQPAKEGVPNVDPRPISDHYVVNWNDEDYERLGVDRTSWSAASRGEP